MQTIDQVRAAAEKRAAARVALEAATRDLREAVQQAKRDGASEAEIARAAGLTRQRVWQLTR